MTARTFTPERFSFNNAAIAALEPVPGKRRAVWDAREPKLCCRISETGTKTFYYVTKVKGRVEWLRLGRFGTGRDDVKVAAARDRAATAKGAFANDENSAKKRRQDRAEPTLRELFAFYCREHRVRSEATRASEWKHLKPFHSRNLSKITRPEDRALIRRVRDKTSEPTANRVLARLRAMYRFGLSEDLWTGADPTAGIKKYPEKHRRRKTRIKHDQLPAFFAALDSVQPLMKDFFLICLFTGARAGNVKTMRWCDIDLTGGVWLIPDTKRGEPIEVSLANPAVEILEARRDNDSEYVFPATRRARKHGKNAHLVTYSKAWAKVCAIAGIEGLRVHDLRRTLSSFAADISIGTAIVAAQLGHADPATTLRHYTATSSAADRTPES